MTNLVKLREAQGLRQEDVAKILGVSRQAYCTYENDKRQAGYETLIKLADYFGVSVDYLLGHDNEKEGIRNMIRLKELRTSIGLQQKEIASALNISKQSYSNYELGQREPSLNMLCTLADYFNVSVDYLLGHDCEKEMPAFQRKTEIQAYFDELSPYEQGEIIGYIKRILYNKGVNADKVKLQYC